MEIPKRILGNTGIGVTILGLGGEGILRTYGHEKEASQLINAAIDLGVNYFESARAYSGSESYYGRSLKDRRKEIFLASKSHARDKQGAFNHLLETLKLMMTDHLDLWQIHDMRTKEDIKEVFGPHGALEAFSDAKEKGLARFIGVTGHHDPSIVKRCIQDFDFDTVLIPVNPAEPVYKNFIDEVIPVAQRKGMGIVGMKVYFRGLAQKIPGHKTLEPFYRFALSHPLSTAVIGCDNIRQLEENVEFARAFKAMSKEEMEGIIDALSPYARQLMYYKPSN
ncbi:MAG TPA: aldo/keto reductase [Thermodesulfovibrionales bacterium]|nr:aldo/keto reductase [Thermodesulfovibrionales bacterium]